MAKVDKTLKTQRLILATLILASCTSTTTPAPTNTTIPTIALTSTPMPIAKKTPVPMGWRWSNALIQFNNMAVLPNSEVWAIGQNGTIIHDRVRIAHLAEVFDYQGERGVGYLSAIDFVSQNDGWITGHGGQILHWNGKSWSNAIPFDFENPILLDIGFADSNNGWAVGCYRDGIDVAVILYWNGYSWQKAPLLENISKGFCFKNIEVVSNTIIWISGENNQNNSSMVLLGDGMNWEEIPISPNVKDFTAISAISDTDLWALAGAKVSHWNGSNWKQIELSNEFWFWYSENEFATPDILALSNKDVWVGGRQLFHWNGLDLENLGYDEKYGWIVDIESDSDNNVWALTFTGGIIKLSE